MDRLRPQDAPRDGEGAPRGRPGLTAAPDRTDAAFAALADPTRREIVALLARKPRVAGEIGAHFEVSQPAISRHLRILRESGLVVAEGSSDDKRSRTYRLRDDGLDRLERWIAETRAFWRAQLGSFAEYVEREKRRVPLGGSKGRS